MHSSAEATPLASAASSARRWTSWRLARLFGVREQRILAIIALKELEAQAGFTADGGDDSDEDELEGATRAVSCV